MSNIFKCYVTTVYIFLLTCHVYAQTSEPVRSSTNDHFLVNGQLVHFKEPLSYEGKAGFTRDSHAVVTLCYLPGMDVSCERLAVQKIEGVTGFPIPFRLEGEPQKTFSRKEGYYLIEAKVYIGAGDQLFVGDYVSDTWNEVDSPSLGKIVTVTRLEHCGHTGAGGACASQKRHE